MKFPVLKIPNAVDVLENSIEGMIFSGALRPETNLPSERKFAEDIGVSRTTLREALSRLQAKGLLHSKSNRHQISDVMNVLLGRAFRQVGENDGRMLFDLLALTSVEMVRLAQDKATPTDGDRIRDAAHELLEAMASEGRDRFDGFYDFMMKLVEANYNFFGIQLVHALVMGFRDPITRGLEIVAGDGARSQRFAGAIHGVMPFDRRSPRALEQLLDGVRAAMETTQNGLMFQAHVAPMDQPPQDRAFQDLLACIATGRYAVGADLPPVKELAAQLGHADNAVQLALHQLATNGVVQLGKQGRARVVSQHRRDPMDALIDAILRQPYAIESTFEFRLMLEEWTAEIAAQKITPKQAKSFDGLFKSMAAALVDDPRKYAQLDIDFHRAIADYSDTPALGALLAAFGRIMEKVTSDWLTRHAEFIGDNRKIHAQHRDIHHAILARDGPQAAKAMRAHLAYVLTGLKALERRKTYQAVSETRGALGG